MNNFPYNLYIGEHIDEPLRVKYNTHGRSGEFYLKPRFMYAPGKVTIKIDLECTLTECIPYVKSATDLTDDEVKYILCDDEEFENETWKIVKDDDCTEIDTYIGCWHDESDSFHFLDYYNPKLTQRQWNRFYSLHCHPNAEELIKNGLAVRKQC